MNKKTPSKDIVTAVVLVLIIAAVGVLFWFSRPPEGDSFGTQPTSLQENNKQAVVEIKGIDVDVEVAESPTARKQGLSGRESLAQGAGMLFVFEEPDKHSFWMKDMNFALDIIWLDEQLTVVDIAKNITPETYPETFAPDKPALYVLEVNAGFADKYGIVVEEKAILQ